LKWERLFGIKGVPGCNRVYFETNPNERFYAYPRELSAFETARMKSDILDSSVKAV